MNIEEKLDLYLNETKRNIITFEIKDKNTALKDLQTLEKNYKDDNVRIMIGADKGMPRDEAKIVFPPQLQSEIEKELKKIKGIKL